MSEAMGTILRELLEIADKVSKFRDSFEHEMLPERALLHKLGVLAVASPAIMSALDIPGHIFTCFECLTSSCNQHCQCIPKLVKLNCSAQYLLRCIRAILPSSNRYKIAEDNFEYSVQKIGVCISIKFSFVIITSFFVLDSL